MAEKVAQKSGHDIFLTRKVTPICKGAARNFGIQEEGLLSVEKKTLLIFFSRSCIGDLGSQKRVSGQFGKIRGKKKRQERYGRFGVDFGGPQKRWAIVTIKGVHHGRGRGNKWHLRCKKRETDP